MASDVDFPGHIGIFPMEFRFLPEVMAIERTSFKTPATESLWANELSNPISVNLVAVIDPGESQEIVGYVNFWVVADEVQCNQIAVAGHFRHRGVACRLLGAMMEKADREGMKAATLEVRASNKEAIGLYNKFGFVIQGRRQGYYAEDGEDALLMGAPIWRP